MAYDQTKFAAVSEDVLSKLLSGDRDLIKTAELSINDFFRTEIRENGIRRQITPLTQLSDEELGYAEDTDFPVYYSEVVGKSAGAKKVSFETGPHNDVVHGRKVRFEFNRIMTPKYSIDKIRLKGYKMPILDVLYDLMLKDIMDCEDRVTLGADNTVLGEVDTANDTGKIRFKRCGSLDTAGRKAIVDLKKAMFKAPGHLQPSKFLMNYGTYCDLGVFKRDEIGGDLAQDMFINGVKLETVAGVDAIITTKDDFVKDNMVYIYAEPTYYGGFYAINDVSMVSDEQDDIWMSFFAHETVSFGIVNIAGVAGALLENPDTSAGGTLKDWD